MIGLDSSGADDVNDEDKAGVDSLGLKLTDFMLVKVPPFNME